MYDVIVVGAGPSGSYIASRLAKFGYKVIVIERKEAAGEDICCTGIVGVECFHTFNLNATILRAANSAKFFAPSGEFLRLHRDDPQAYILDRPSLDKSLEERAQRYGAEYLFSTSVIDVSTEPDSASVIVDQQGQQRKLTAGTVVLACGFGSSLPEKVGLGRINNFVFGAQAEVGTINVDEVEVYFDQNLLPGFFGWLVPTRANKGLAGLLVRQDPALRLGNLLSRLKSQGKITSNQVDMKFGTIPMETMRQTFGKRIIVVGEAAGQVKPTTGGGIYYGLLCADIAANTLHQAFIANDFSPAKLSVYDKQWRTRLGHELKTDYRARRLYNRLSNQHIEYLFQLSRNNGIPGLISKWQDFSFDWHRPLISKTLKHLALTAPRQTIKGLLNHSG
ncbi:MAG: NAD(P)/FAD-dependent oxidoreductase [Chloroflexota bacterium]|nr:NAD(P)/FAD-dependent oxidoreductase [Chloroflexota bacterium]